MPWIINIGLPSINFVLLPTFIGLICRHADDMNILFTSVLRRPHLRFSSAVNWNKIYLTTRRFWQNQVQLEMPIRLSGRRQLSCDAWQTWTTVGVVGQTASLWSVHWETFLPREISGSDCPQDIAWCVGGHLIPAIKRSLPVFQGHSTDKHILGRPPETLTPELWNKPTEPWTPFFIGWQDDVAKKNYSCLRRFEQTSLF